MSAARDFALGARLAVSGGREGWARTLLVALGVALGVGVLLAAAGVPAAITAGDRRDAARAPVESVAPPGEQTVRVAYASGTFRDVDYHGLVVEPLGSRPALPPGVERLPGEDEMLVSPALARLLRASGSALLRERLGRRVVGTIGPDGLRGPGEPAFVAGGEVGAAGIRVDGFGFPHTRPEIDALFLLVILVGVVALLMPVAAFVGAAARIGGEARDRRLAAVRLVGADRAMARRIAAGEVLAGALAGVLLGGLGFVVLRPLVERVELWDISMFAADLSPAPALVALIAAGVPALAVGAALIALRGVVIEPLGVVRRATPRRRRVLWRLAAPAAALALLVPLLGSVGPGAGSIPEYQLAGGMVLLLGGVVVLLPWLVEALVRRLGGAGGVAWQLAVRRLQLESGSGARVVGGLVVAVAGAIALQSVFAGVERATGAEPLGATRANASVTVPPDNAAELARRLEAAPGTRVLVSVREAYLVAPGGDAGASLLVGGCAALREFARLGRCRDGDAFVVDGGDAAFRAVARPGRRLLIEGESQTGWRVPATARRGAVRRDPAGGHRVGVLATPAAAGRAAAAATGATLFLALDPDVPDAVEHARNAVAAVDLAAPLSTIGADTTPSELRTIRAWLLAGAVVVLALIAAGLLIGVVEQLRERRRLLAALLAIGVRRRTLGAAVLVQTAVPVVLGLVLAIVAGGLLGALLLRIASEPVVLDAGMIGALAGAAAAVVALVTGLSVPLLLHAMRPEGLRTE